MHARTLAMIAALLLAAWTWRAAGVSAAPSLAPSSRVIAAATLQSAAQAPATTEKSVARERKDSSAAALPRLRAGQIAQRLASAP
ncbi:MAG: hypothetical protein WAK01_15800 [Methylocystis sp.]